MRDHDWFTVDDSPQQALANADEIALADGADFRRKRLLEWRRDGRAIPNHPYARRGPMARAYRLTRQRSLSRLTEYDGNLSGIKEIDGFGIRPDGAPISPTALETWAACPYRYFLGHVLRLGALDAPEEIFSISALDRGTLGHEILERFIRESRQGGHLPPPGQPWGPGDRERLMRIAAQSFQEAETRGVTGKRLLWDMAKTEILSDLETFLEADSLLREASETADVRVETRFGFAGDSTEVIDPDSGIRFRGMIDRMDVSGDGKAVLVVDYKTGSAEPYKGLDDDPIDQGRRLQLGVYSLAARASFPDATDVSAAYWFSTNRGGFQFAPAARFNITDESVAKRFREGVAGIVDGINGESSLPIPARRPGTGHPTASIATSTPFAPRDAPISGSGRNPIASLPAICNWRNPTGRATDDHCARRHHRQPSHRLCSSRQRCQENHRRRPGRNACSWRPAPAPAKPPASSSE